MVGTLCSPAAQRKQAKRACINQIVVNKNVNIIFGVIQKIFPTETEKHL